MAIRSHENLVGAWAFFIGIILALILGLVQVQIGTPQYGWIYAVLAAMGIIVGLSNIGDKDVDKFLIASVSVVIVSYMGQSALRVASNIGLIIANMSLALLVMAIPATIIVALKAVFAISKS